MRRYLCLILLPVLLLAGFFIYRVTQKGESGGMLMDTGVQQPVFQGEFKPGEGQGEKNSIVPLGGGDRTITKAGTYSGAGSLPYDNVVVKASGTVLKDMTVRGDLMLDRSLNAAQVTLENVTVLGNVYLYGTGDCHYNMKDFSAANVVVNAPKCVTRLGFSGKVSIEKMEVDTDVSITGGSIVYDTANRFAIDEMLVPQVQAHRVYVELSGLSIQNLSLRNITTFTIDNYTLVETLRTYTESRLQGMGHVELLQAYADGVTYETQPVRIEVGEGIAPPTGREKETNGEEGKYRRLAEPDGLVVMLDDETEEYIACWEPVEGAAVYQIACYLDGVQVLQRSITAQPPQFSLISRVEYERMKPDSLRIEVYAVGDQRETVLNSFISSVEYTYDSLRVED